MTNIYNSTNYTPEESIGWLLKRCGSQLTITIDRALADYEMTHAQLGIFIRLGQATTRTASDLAREGMTDTGSMTRMLDRLEEKGFVARTRDANDRRVIQVELTDKGRQLSAEVIKVAVASLNHHLRGFSQDEVAQFKDFLRRMIANA